MKECTHQWKQEYLFMQSSWFECELCGKKEFWCGTFAHKKPSDCSTYEGCLGKEGAKQVFRDCGEMAEILNR